MPDSAGKRQRREVKAKKRQAREELRIARNQRRANRGNQPADWLAQPDRQPDAREPDDAVGAGGLEPPTSSP